MKRTTPLATLTSLAAAALFLAGCTASPGGEPTTGGGGGEQASLRIAGIGNNAGDPFYTTLMCGATKAANELGVDLEWAAPNTNSLPEQQTNFEAALLNDPDGVLITPADAAAFSVQIEDLMADGVPVVSSNLAPDPDTGLQSFLSSRDNTEFIQFVLDDMGDTGKIGILGGLAGGSEVLQSRWRPLVEQLAEQAPGIEVLDTEYSEFDRNKATTIAASMITAHPDLTAIYSVSGPEGEGVAAAVEEAGKTGDIRVYAYDATPGEVEALRNGTITALLAQPAGLLGSSGVERLVEYLEANPDREPVTEQDEAETLPLGILTADNIDDAESEPYIYSASCDE